LSRSPEPSDFALAKAEDDVAQGADHTAVDVDTDNQDQILAADYDPSLDRREDEQKRIGNVVAGLDPRTNDEVEEVEEVEEEEDLDDMFAVTTGKKSKKIVKKVVVSAVLFPDSKFAADMQFIAEEDCTCPHNNYNARLCFRPGGLL